MRGEMILQCPYCAEKDAEVQRLKESAKYDAFLRKKYRGLITELCDALDRRGRFLSSCVGDSTLLKHAREATR
jgi:hypothetical protein